MKEGRKTKMRKREARGSQRELKREVAWETEKERERDREIQIG